MATMEFLGVVTRGVAILYNPFGKPTRWQEARENKVVDLIKVMSRSLNCHDLIKAIVRCLNCDDPIKVITLSESEFGLLA